MEVWQEKLQGAINREFWFEDEYDKFEEDFLLQMVALVADELESEPHLDSQPGGSQVGREFLYCDREGTYERLYCDYFSNRPTYGPIKFRRRYKMRRELFLRIMDAVTNFDPWLSKDLMQWGG